MKKWKSQISQIKLYDFLLVCRFLLKNMNLLHYAKNTLFQNLFGQTILGFPEMDKLRMYKLKQPEVFFPEVFFPRFQLLDS